MTIKQVQNAAWIRGINFDGEKSGETAWLDMHMRYSHQTEEDSFKLTHYMEFIRKSWSIRD